MLVAMLVVPAVFCKVDKLPTGGSFCETARLCTVAGRLFGKLFCMRWL